MASHQPGTPPPIDRHSPIESSSAAAGLMSLPKVHLGSFSAMDIVGNMYNDDDGSARIAIPTEQRTAAAASPDIRTPPGDGPGSNGGGRTISNTEYMSMTSDGRAWAATTATGSASRPDPRATTSSPTPPTHNQNQYQPTRQASVLSSPSSLLPSGSISQQPMDTPPTEVGSPSPSATPKSLSYLPPGAASPHYTTPTKSYPSENTGMAGIGSGGGSGSVRTTSGYSRPGRPPSSSPPPQEQPPSRDRGVRSPYSAAAELSQQQPNEVLDGFRDVADDAAAAVPGPSQQRQSQRRSTTNPSPPNPSPDLRKMNLEPYGATNGLVGMQEPLYGLPSSSRRKTSQYYPQTSQNLPVNVNQVSPYPSMPSASPQQQQPYVNDPQPQLQTRGGPKVASVVVEEVCIECMMRDRDMADIDVLGEGVWERESDASYHELVRMEEEADYRARMSGTPSSSMDYHQSTGRPRARGGPLTSDNLKVWLTMVCIRPPSIIIRHT